MPANSTNPGSSSLDSETGDGNHAPHSKILQQDSQLIQIVDAALADATLRAGSHLACRPGCTQCCHGAFAISPLDALRLREAMTKMSLENPAQAEAIAERASQYLATFGPSFPGNRETGILGTTPEDEAAFEDFASEAPCPALNPATGLCDIYTARPMTCRIFGPPVRMAETNIDSGSESTEGLAVCELCFTQATPEEIAAAEMTVPWSEEHAILDQLGPGDTIVAYCLTLPPRPTLQSS